MKHLIPLLIALSALSLSACKDETISGYAGAGTTWALEEIYQRPFTSSATLTFTGEGTISGQAPCNTYGAKQTAPYPWFEVEQLFSTKMACDDLADEQRFLAALQAMRQSEVSGDVLILSNAAGRLMVFRARR